ncbi:BnaC03g21970D [Brassica napus]|uniref:BnaC03g21970D protein n=1 Tax=Brassica napus TaxID=3708 RepID=A0A078GEN6_BRANA|nr:BnaC03g21970D [Brassica napus]
MVIDAGGGSARRLHRFPSSRSRRNTPKYCARRLDRSKTLCLLPDVTLNTLNQNECDVNMLRSVSITNYWLRHGNVEVQGFDPSKLLSSSSNSIVLSVPKKAKLALEIHLVSLRSFVEFRTDPTNFSAKSSQIGLLLGVAQSLGASHQKLLSRNSPTASYWCINVDFDYQLFLRTIALGIKVKLLYGVFHLAELDSPLISFILLCFIMLSTFVVPSSMSPNHLLQL